MRNLLLLTAVLFFHQQAFGNACNACDELAKVEAEYSVKGADQAKFEALQLKGAQVIEKMTKGKSLVLTKSQVDAVVKFMRVAVPKDPGRSFTMNIDQYLVANRKSFDTAIAKLPKAEADLLADAVDFALQTDVVQDPEAASESMEAAPLGQGKSEPKNK